MSYALDPPTKNRPPRLWLHITVVLIIKVILLYGLWYAFIKPNKVTVDSAKMGSHLLTRNEQTLKDKQHD